MDKKETLSIENFLGIRKLKLEINDINLLIGPQAVGKSITLKLVYFFKKIRSLVLEYYSSEKKTGITLEETICDYFKKIFPFKSYQETCEKTSSRITYRINDLAYTINISKKVTFESSSAFNHMKENLEEIQDSFTRSRDRDTQSKKELLETPENRGKRVRERVQEEINNIIDEEILLFVPSGRSFFAALEKNIWSKLSSDSIGGNSLNLDPIIRDFGAFYEGIKDLYSGWELHSNLLEKQLFQAEYVREAGHDYLKHKDERRVEMHQGSSGQQESLPLALLLEVLSHAAFNASSTVLFIEEPEAHLFPNAQKEIVYAIVSMLNEIILHKGLGIKILLTTHSPYIMTSFNNLLYAGKIAQDSSKKAAVTKIVSEEHLIRPDKLGAYYLEEELVDIMEDGFIVADKIDAISEVILKDFDELLEVDSPEEHN